MCEDAVKFQFGGDWGFLDVDQRVKLIIAEINTRDIDWLRYGIIHKPTYATSAIKKSVTVDNPWEDRSARRLAAHGINPFFAVDYKMVRNNEASPVCVGG